MWACLLHLDFKKPQVQQVHNTTQSKVHFGNQDTSRKFSISLFYNSWWLCRSFPLVLGKWVRYVCWNMKIPLNLDWKWLSAWIPYVQCKMLRYLICGASCQADTCSHCVFVASSWFRDWCRGPLSRVPSYLPGYLLFEAVRTGLWLVRWPQYWPLIGWSHCMLFMFWRSHNAVWQGTGLYLFLFLLRHTRLGWATCL